MWESEDLCASTVSCHRQSLSQGAADCSIYVCTERLTSLVQTHAPLQAKARRNSFPWRADDAKELLTKIGAETSLRYAIHLITAASLIATRRKAAAVEIEDVSKAYQLFIDVRRSTQFLIEYQARLTRAAGSASGCLHESARNTRNCAAYMRAAMLCWPFIRQKALLGTQGWSYTTSSVPVSHVLGCSQGV